MNPIAIQSTLRRAGSGLAASLLFTTLAHAGAQPFSKIVTFGDSLSDTGNAFMLTGTDPDGLRFWDGVHPTSDGHETVAERAIRQVVSFYSPRKGRGTGRGLVNSLNGLVPASTR